VENLFENPVCHDTIAANQNKLMRILLLVKLNLNYYIAYKAGFYTITNTTKTIHNETPDLR